MASGEEQLSFSSPSSPRLIFCSVCCCDCDRLARRSGLPIVVACETSLSPSSTLAPDEIESGIKNGRPRPGTWSLSRAVWIDEAVNPSRGININTADTSGS
jgi:hypothetical protein